MREDQVRLVRVVEPYSNRLLGWVLSHRTGKGVYTIDNERQAKISLSADEEGIDMQEWIERAIDERLILSDDVGW